jgi:hypothetical protein|tara:strand:+ start:2528 stop:3523 length:996 start_codon:yes stop_codon:yes gene_type:complete
MNRKSYPYDTYEPSIKKLQLKDIELDGKIIEKELVVNETQQINIYDTDNPDWGNLKFRAQIAFPENFYKDLMQEKEEIQGCIQMQCSDTRVRLKFELKQSKKDSSLWTGNSEVNKTVLGGSVSVKIIFWLTNGSGFSRYIARSRAWALRFDKPESLDIGGFFDIKWVNFQDSESGVPDKYKNEPFYINLTKEPPTLLLNSGVDGLKAIIRDGKLSGGEEILRDMITMQIVSSGYNALYASSIAGIQKDTDSGEFNFPGTAWKKQLMEELIREIYPGDTTDDALKKLYDQWSEGEADFVESELQSMITSRLNYESKIRKAMTILEHEERGEN